MTPESRKSSATATPASRTPPGLLRRSSTKTLDASWIVAPESRNGPADVLRRGLAEARDAQVPVARLEGLGDHAVHLDLGAAQGVLGDAGHAVAADGELHEAPRGAAHAGDGTGEVRADVGAVDAHDLVAGQEPGLLRRRAVDRAQDPHHAVLGHHLDADARVGAHGGQADLVELLAVEVGGVRVERGDHAAHRLLHERVVVDVVDVLALDALVDFREQARLLPRQAGARGLRQRLAGTRRAAVGEHAAGEGTAEAENDPRGEGEERARARLHVIRNLCAGERRGAHAR